MSDHLDKLFNAAESIEYHRRELVGADHAMPMGRMDGMGEALLAARARADEAGQSLCVKHIHPFAMF